MCSPAPSPPDRPVHLALELVLDPSRAELGLHLAPECLDDRRRVAADSEGGHQISSCLAQFDVKLFLLGPGVEPGGYF
jgi:hypothetical protein